MSDRKDFVAKLLSLCSERPLRSLSPALVLPFLAVSSAHAQALPAATREPVQVGVAYSTASPDFTYPYIDGFTIFADAGIRRRLSAEFDMHLVSFITPGDIGENSYLIGPRFNVLSQDRFRAYVKVMGGIGRFQYQAGSYANPYTANYSIVAGGGGFEYRATRHINVRVLDVSVQRWLSFPPNGLTPVVYSFGAAYIP